MRARTAVIVLTAVIGVAVSGVVYRALAARESARVESQFLVDAEARIRGIEREFATDLEVVHSVRAFYAGSIEVDRGEFKAFVSPALERRTSLLALEWAPFVREDGREAHEAAMHAEGLDGYRIHRWRAGSEPGDCYPLTFVEPMHGNERLLGLDLGSESTRRESLLQARDSGNLTMSRRIRLMQDEGLHYGIVLLGAIYDNHADTSTITARQQHLTGLVVAVLRIDNLVRNALEQFRPAGIEIVVREGERTLHAHRPGAVADREGVTRDANINVGGRRLTIQCTPTEDYVADARTLAPLATSAALLFATLLMVIYLRTLASRTARIENVVAERTATIEDVTRLQQAILDAANYTIISTDPQGVIRTFNAAAETMLGYRASELVGRETPALIHREGEVRERAEALTKELGRPIEPGFEVFVAKAAAGGPDENEWTYVRKDGSEFPVRLSVTALFDDRGRITGYLGVGHDITHMKKHEDELEKARAAAETANVAKSRFMANMSHELRTPLNAIIGYSEMLEEDAAKAGMEQCEADLQSIKAAGRHLLQLINDVLDLSKIEAGRMELHEEPVDLPAAIEDIAATVSPLVAERGNTLELDVAPDLGTVRLDVMRLKQILLNLLSNAAKFTEKGTIRLAARADAGWIELRVADTGMGMSREQLEHAFQPFSQADSSTTRRHGGTGLGLAICKQFCELLGGEITVESEPGRGSAFTVRLPVPGTAGAELERAPEPAGGRDTVLVIDDDPSVQGLMRRILDREGFRVVGAPDGARGLEMARREHPVAIILDVVMPSMDGWAVLSALKADAELAPIPVVMQTMMDDRSTGYALGAAGYLVKPIERARLLELLRRFQTAAGTGSVIVVEDDSGARDLAVRTLREAGWTVREASNGKEAMERIHAEMPDLILLDLLMPEMDGFELVEEVHGDETLRSIPIVVLTAKDLTSEERERLNGRVRRVLRKGAHRRDELLDEVCRLVRESAG